MFGVQNIGGKILYFTLLYKLHTHYKRQAHTGLSHVIEGYLGSAPEVNWQLSTLCAVGCVGLERFPSKTHTS